MCLVGWWGWGIVWLWANVSLVWLWVNVSRAGEEWVGVMFVSGDGHFLGYKFLSSVDLLFYLDLICVLLFPT